MKKHTEKHANIPGNIGHNKPPKDIEPIEFTNSAIKAIKINEYDFGKKSQLEIPFIVPKGSHLKGLVLTITEKTKRKIFTLRFYLSGKQYRHHLGDFKAYKSSNNQGFGCIQVNAKQNKLYDEHTSSKGLYIKSIKLTEKIKETKITEIQKETYKSLTLRDVIELICKDGFPKMLEEETLSKRALADYFRYLCGYNWRARHIYFYEDENGCGAMKFRINPKFSRFNTKTKAVTSWDQLFKKFPSGKSILKKELHFNPTGSTSLYDDEFSKNLINNFTMEDGPGMIEGYLEKIKVWGTKRNVLDAIRYMLNYALDKRIIKHRINPASLVRLKKPGKIVNYASKYNETVFSLEDLNLIYKACMEISQQFPYQAECIMMMMFTGRRFQETSKLKWINVKEDQRIIEIPRAINKIRVDQFITITEPVQMVLNYLKDIPNRPGMEKFKVFEREKTWMFPSMRFRVADKWSPTSDKARLKVVFRAWSLIRKMTGVVGATKTLRKSFSTLAKDTLGSTGSATKLTGHLKDETLDRFYYKTHKERIIKDADSVGNLLMLNLPQHHSITKQ